MHSFGKEEIKLFLFVGEMIAYVEQSQGSTKKLLKLISESNSFVGCKINIHKSIIFLYTNNEHIETKIKNIMAFTIIL